MWRQHWYKPGFWKWWWRNRAAHQTKLVLLIPVALALGLGGYLSVGTLNETLGKEEQVVQVVTVLRTTQAPGKPPRVVTEITTVTQPGTTNVETETVRRNGETVVVRSPGETITNMFTIRGPIRKRVVTNTDTVVRNRLRTVRLPGTTVTRPGETIVGPGTTVTTPGKTETETAVREVTLTETNHVTVTNETTVTNEVTITETETVTVTEPGEKP